MKAARQQYHELTTLPIEGEEREYPKVALKPEMVEALPLEVINRFLRANGSLPFPAAGSEGGWKIIGVNRIRIPHGNDWYVIHEVYVEAPWGDKRSYYMKSAGGAGCVLIPFARAPIFGDSKVLMVRQSRAPLGGAWTTELARAGTPPKRKLARLAGYGEGISSSSDNPEFNKLVSLTEWRNAKAVRAAGLPLSTLALLERELGALIEAGISIRGVIPLGKFFEDTGISMVPVYVYAFELDCIPDRLSELDRHRDGKRWELRVHTVDEIELNPDELGADAHSSTAIRRFLAHHKKQQKLLSSRGAIGVSA